MFLPNQLNFTKLHLKIYILLIICLKKKKKLVKIVINSCVEKKYFDFVIFLFRVFIEGKKNIL